MQSKSIKSTYRGLLAGACFATLLVAGAAGSAFAADYAPVTDARLANPEPENWLMTRGNYKGWSYSALDQINAHNVKNLVPVWSVSTGVDSGHESPPIVNNGVMFITTPYSQVMALNAATGDLLWRYKRALPEGFSALHNTNRGVALYGDKVYFAPLDAVLVALDAQTGKKYWDYDLKAEVWGSPYWVDGKVYIGTGDGDVHVFAHGKEKKVLGKIEMEDAINSTPVACNGVLYVMTMKNLFAISGHQK